MKTTNSHELTDKRHVIIGVVGKAHGLGGGVRIYRYNPASELWRRGQSVELFQGDWRQLPSVVNKVENTQQLTILQVDASDDNHGVVFFKGIEHRDQAEALNHYIVAVLESQLAPSSGNSFYYYEVIGWDVQTFSGKRLGQVTRVYDTYTTLIEFRSVDNRIRSLTAIEPLLMKVDRETKTLIFSDEAQPV